MRGIRDRRRACGGRGGDGVAARVGGSAARGGAGPTRRRAPGDGQPRGAKGLVDEERLRRNEAVAQRGSALGGTPERGARHRHRGAAHADRLAARDEAARLQRGGRGGEGDVGGGGGRPQGVAAQGAPSTRTMQSRATRRGTKRWPESPARTRRASAARDRRAASSVTRRARTAAPATRVCPSAARAARRPMAQAAAAALMAAAANRASAAEPRHQRFATTHQWPRRAARRSPTRSAPTPSAAARRAYNTSRHSRDASARHSASMPRSTASVAASRAAQRRRAHAARHVRRGAGSAGRTRRRATARSARSVLPRRSDPS